MFNYLYLLAIASLALLGQKDAALNHSANAESDSTYTKAQLIIHFENVKNEKIRNSFTEVLWRYKELHDCEITLVQSPIKSSTMQAQPIVKLANLFGQTKKYRVKLALLVRDSKSIKVADLPADVLTGWFAHELGHIVDYHTRNNFHMLFFGFK